MVLTDPPYGIANEVIITRSRKAQKFGKAKAITHNFGEWDKFVGFDVFMIFTKRWVDAVVSKLKGGGVCWFLFLTRTELTSCRIICSRNTVLSAKDILPL